MKAASAFVGFVLVGFALFVGYLIWVEPHCSEISSPSNIESQHRTKNDRKATGQNVESTNADHKSAAYSLAIIKTVLAESENAEAQSGTDHANWKPMGWWKKFLCDAKITDVALAFFTYCLIVVGGFQARYLYHTVIATRTAAEHIPRVERAFIHGGVHPGGRTLICGGKKIRVRFSMANYGKTPGFIKSVKVGSGQLAGLSDDPNYSAEVPVSDLFFPLMTMSELRYLDDVEVTIPADGKYVIFQRVFYDDVFGKPHSSGSLHRMYVEAETIRDQIVTGKPKYWEWD